MKSPSVQRRPVGWWCVTWTNGLAQSEFVQLCLFLKGRGFVCASRPRTFGRTPRRRRRYLQAEIQGTGAGPGRAEACNLVASRFGAVGAI